jgi:outer membrane scaffolding protein for murein synthesis (MipA/OmpV family)
MRKPSIFRRAGVRPALWLFLAALTGLAAAPVRAHTPSPLAEWQYSSGIQLQRMFEPSIPTWQTELGLGAEGVPEYDGAGRYQIQPGPVVDIRYKDIAFASTGEGIGANLFDFRHVRFGAAITYDLGRSPHIDGKALTDLGTIHPAPEIKIFADYTLSESVPIDIRVDARKQLGATNGYIGDVGAYLPLPGSSQRFAWFAGPTVTFADNRYMNGYFGISNKQAQQTTYRRFKAWGGLKSAGLGVSMIYFVNPHVILTVNGAFDRLLGAAANSPITTARYQAATTVAALYRF